MAKEYNEGPMQGNYHTPSPEDVDQPIKDTNPKRAFGDAKPGVSNVPLVPLFELGEVMKNGAAKYGPFNWRKDPVSMSTYIDAIFRHWAQVSEGQDTDPDSDLAHLAHIMASCAIVLDAKAHGTLIDDRTPSQVVTDFLSARR